MSVFVGRRALVSTVLWKMAIVWESCYISKSRFLGLNKARQPRPPMSCTRIICWFSGTQRYVENRVVKVYVYVCGSLSTGNHSFMKNVQTVNFVILMIWGVKRSWRIDRVPYIPYPDHMLILGDPKGYRRQGSKGLCLCLWVVEHW